MKRSEKFFLRSVADTYFLYSLEDADYCDHKMIFLNETSAFLWNNMEESCTLDDLVKTLSSHFDVQNEIAHADVKDFIAFLSNNGCIDMEEDA